MQENLNVPTGLDSAPQGTKPSVFRLMNDENKEVLLPFYFDEKHFLSKHETTPNKQLATMSCIVALSAFSHFREGDKRYFNQDADLRYLLTGEADSTAHPYPDYKKYDTATLGFTGYQESDSYHEQPKEDSIAYSIATKPLSSSPGSAVVCLAIRGGGYESEWCSNFKVGELQEEAYHKGFYEASSQVICGLEKYLRAIRDQYLNIKLWIVGYSRGAAVANITAHRIKTGRWMNDWKINGEDIYTYTFETPAGYRKIPADNKGVEDCPGVYNQINYLDFIPRIVFEDWNFLRVGTDYTFPCIGKCTDFNSKWAAVVWCMNKYLNQGSSNYNSISVNTEFPVFLDNTIKMIAPQLSLEELTSKYQKPVGTLLSWFMVLSTKEMEQLQSGYGILHLVSLALNVLYSNKKETVESSALIFFMYVSPNISDKKCQDLIDSVVSLSPLFKKIYDGYKWEQLLPLAIAFAMVPWTHAPLLCLSWLMSQDTRYTASLDSAALEAVEASLAAEQSTGMPNQLINITNEEFEALFTELKSCDDPSAQQEIIKSWVSQHS